MKIINIKTYPVSLRLKEPFVIGNVINEHMRNVIVEIKTDAGLVGYGEVIPAWEVTGETQCGVMGAIALLTDRNLLGESLIGQEISSLDDVVKINEHFLDSKEGPSLIVENPSAKCGIECALLDLVGKLKDRPVYDLLGGTNQPLSLPLVLGIGPVEVTLERAVRGISEGYKTVKLKVGHETVGNIRNYERDIEVVNQLVSYVRSRGLDVKVVADANQGYRDSATTLKIINLFDPGLAWLEQPVLATDKEGLRDVRKKSRIPIMADEAVHDYQDAKLILALEAADYLNIKLMKSGGILGARRIACLAEEHHIPCQIGSMLESTLGTAMGAAAYLSIPNFKTNELVGMNFMQENLGKGVTSNTNLNLPKAAGFGVEYAPEDFSRSRTRLSDCPALSRIVSIYSPTDVLSEKRVI